MIQSYTIDGMTCGNCVAKVTKLVETVPGVDKAIVQLKSPQLKLHSQSTIAIESLSNALGKYQIAQLKDVQSEVDPLAEKSLTTYKPLILIIAFITLVSVLAQFHFESFNVKLWMRHFMAGFFIVFSFFKFLNLSGFADSYSMYDIIAKRWKTWGIIYPFLELGLGVLYLINIYPVATNVFTIALLGISSIGVIQSVLRKDQIKCACLGDVFNLPMSTVTIIEDVAMVGMAILMLLMQH